MLRDPISAPTVDEVSLGTLDLASADGVLPPRRRPYFRNAAGTCWTPVGHNEAITWPPLEGLFRRRDLSAVEAHLRFLVDSGVTCLRLMLEYAHGEHRYLEKPIGRFVSAMVQLWDDMIAMCERVGMRLLLTPFDTYFTWVRWKAHPLNRAKGGPCASRRALLTCLDTRRAIMARLEFATLRWGGSPAEVRRYSAGICGMRSIRLMAMTEWSR